MNERYKYTPYSIYFVKSTSYERENNKGIEYTFNVISKNKEYFDLAYQDLITIDDENNISVISYGYYSLDIILDCFYERDKIKNIVYDIEKYRLLLNIKFMEWNTVLTKEERINYEEMKYKYNGLYGDNEFFKLAYIELENYLLQGDK
jgi:hypothetical protein